MSGNSNPSINSSTSTHHGSPATTAIDNDATFTTQLLEEFNAQQAHHISVSSSSSVQHVPHSPTPSMQEVASPPPLHIHINPNPTNLHPPILPGSAETILHMDEGSNLHNTTHTITY